MHILFEACSASESTQIIQQMTNLSKRGTQYDVAENMNLVHTSFNTTV